MIMVSLFVPMKKISFKVALISSRKHISKSTLSWRTSKQRLSASKTYLNDAVSVCRKTSNNGSKWWSNTSRWVAVALVLLLLVVEEPQSNNPALLKTASQLSSKQWWLGNNSSYSNNNRWCKCRHLPLLLRIKQLIQPSRRPTPRCNKTYRTSTRHVMRFTRRSNVES